MIQGGFCAMRWLKCLMYVRKRRTNRGQLQITWQSTRRGWCGNGVSQGMNRSTLFAGVAVFGLAVAGLAFALWSRGGDQVSETTPFEVAGLYPMTYERAQAEFWRLAPALLRTIYHAFGQADETAIYDTLALATDGDALEYLYLERVGAMARGGLQEADQTIHETKLLPSEVARDGARLEIDTTWQVIGTVGHAEHMHVRGNTYSADLIVMPVDGFWKITDFTLRDVNRDAAGEMFLAPDAPGGESNG